MPALRQVDLATPHFMDRVADMQQEVASGDVNPELADADRELLANTLGNLRRWIADRGAAEPLVHGEPHPWNVLGTKDRRLLRSFGYSARAPVAHDLDRRPREASE